MQYCMLPTFNLMEVNTSTNQLKESDFKVPCHLDQRLSLASVTKILVTMR